MARAVYTQAALMKIKQAKLDKIKNEAVKQAKKDAQAAQRKIFMEQEKLAKENIARWSTCEHFIQTWEANMKDASTGWQWNTQASMQGPLWGR